MFEPIDKGESLNRPLRVLFLNTRDALAADVSVHLSLARAFDRTQTRIWVATNTNEAAAPSARLAFESVPDLTVIPLDLGCPIDRRSSVARLKASIRNVRAVASLMFLARSCPKGYIDVIHVTDRPRDISFGLALARLMGSTCVVHAHNNYYAHDASRKDNWLLRHADAVIGVSQFTASTYVRDAGLPEHSVFAVHNAVNGDVFRPHVPSKAGAVMRERLGIPIWAPVIGCVERLSRWKNQAGLIDAFVAVRRRVPDAHLVLAGKTTDAAPDGHGNYKDYLVRKIGALGLGDAITFAGWVPEDTMPNFYAAIDVLAHPAIEEPFGLVLIEAMACARPVVAVAAGGVPEIIRDGVDGLLVSGDSDALANGLTRVLLEPALARRLAYSGYTRAHTSFAPQAKAAEVLDVYRLVVARHAATGAARRPAVNGRSGGEIAAIHGTGESTLRGPFYSWSALAKQRGAAKSGAVHKATLGYECSEEK